MIDYLNLKKKHLSLLTHLCMAGEKFFKVKTHKDLSPIGVYHSLLYVNVFG